MRRRTRMFRVGGGLVASLDAALEAVDRRAGLLLDALLELLDLFGVPDRADVADEVRLPSGTVVAKYTRPIAIARYSRNRIM